MKSTFKKNKNLTPIQKRQIELLKKYHEVDDEKRIAKVKLTYEKASDLLTSDCASNEYPEFNPDILLRLSQIISHVPLGYKVNLLFAIKDYEGINPSRLLEALNDAVEIGHYYSLREVKRNGLRIAFLLVAGIVALVFKILGAEAGWFGSGTSNDLISEIIDIIGWVFIWEAVSIMFLSPSEERTRTVQFRTRIDSISFVKESDESILSSEKCEKVFEQWAEESKLKRLSRTFLLSAGSGFIAIAFSSLIANATSIINLINLESPLYLSFSILFSLVSFTVTVIAGIGAISRYLGHGPFQKSVPFFAVFCLFVAITSIVMSFVNVPNGGFNARTFVSGLFSLVFYFMYVIGWVFNFKRD